MAEFISNNFKVNDKIKDLHVKYNYLFGHDKVPKTNDLDVSQIADH